MSKSYDVYLDTGFTVELSSGDFDKEGELSEAGRQRVLAKLQERLSDPDWAGFNWEETP